MTAGASEVVLRLFIAGSSPNSVAARAVLARALAHPAAARVVLELVDVLVEPERGLADGILVTPTLVRIQPAPQRRVIGNLRDRTALMALLGSVGLEIDDGR